jgi:nucleoside-diphosphate-sugar epimerase
MIQEIFHLASLASPPYYKKFPIQTLDVGYIGTKNVLELCKYYTERMALESDTISNSAQLQCCKVLFTSTSEIYGDALEHPQTESYYGNVNTCGERSCYDESKRIGETLCHTYKTLYGLETRIVRIFNTYGPYMSLGDGRIVTEIIRSMLTGSQLTIYGDGTQTRSLTFVSDTVDMLLKVMNSNYNNPVNIGSNREVNINSLVAICKDLFTQYTGEQCNLEVRYMAIDKDDPKVRRPDLTLNKQVIGELHPTSLETGFRSTLAYFMNLSQN